MIYFSVFLTISANFSCLKVVTLHISRRPDTSGQSYYETIADNAFQDGRIGISALTFIEPYVF